jgi:hypothetical protein
VTPDRLSVVEAYGTQLTSLPERRRVPPVRRLAGAGAVAAAVALVGAMVLAGDGPYRALAVERHDGVTIVRLADATARPWQLTQELQAAGIEGYVLVAPATPDAVGTWVEVKSPRMLPPDADPARHGAVDEAAEARRAAERLAPIRVEGADVRIPAGYGHPLVLIAGAAPREGQRPVYGTGGRLPVHSG